MTDRQTPRERVRTALAHQKPDRVPFSWGFGPTPEMTAQLESELGVDWGKLRACTDDIVTVTPAYTGPDLPPDTDIWGVVRQRVDYGGGSYNEIAVYPLAGIEDPLDLLTYPWPDPTAYNDAALPARILAADPEFIRAHKLNIPACGNPFEIYCWMTGLEEAMTNLVLRPDVVRVALEHITAFFEERLRLSLQFTDGMIDLLYFADDLGGQKGLFMSPDAYRTALQPYHERLMKLGKALAPDAVAMLHSDGAVFDILPDLIDAGLDVLEAVQVDAAGMDPAALKAAYGERLAFHGGISVQALLPHGTPEEVRAACKELVATFGADGGYIAAPTHAVQVGTPVENVLAMLESVLGPEDYAEALEYAR